jgi:hypothetical protein
MNPMDRRFAICGALALTPGVLQGSAHKILANPEEHREQYLTLLKRLASYTGRNAVEVKRLARELVEIDYLTAAQSCE